MSRRASLAALVELLAERGLLTGRLPRDDAWWGDRAAEYDRVALAGDRIGPGALLVDTFSRGRRGRRRLARAVRSRPIALLGSRAPAHKGDVGFIAVTDVWRSLAAAAALLEGFPGRQLRVAGVTGTNGKTSVSTLIARCLEHEGIPAALVGSATQRIGDRFDPPTLTTPDAAELQTLLGRAVRAGCRHAVLEVSSHGLSQWRVAEIGFDVAIVTNVGLDHTDYHVTRADYLEAKSRLMRLLRPGGVAIAWAHDPGAMTVAARAPAEVVRVGTAADCAARLDDASLRFGPELASRLGREPASLSLPARDGPAHERSNAALAATAAFAMGACASSIETALASYPGLPRRAARSTIGGRCVLDDFGSNPASARVLFQMIREQGWDQHGVVVVASPRGSRGARLNREMGQTLGEALRALRRARVIVTAAADAVARADRVHRAELDAYVGALRRSGLDPVVARRLRSAVARALRGTPRECLLVLLGAQGMDAGTAAVREWTRMPGRRGAWAWRRLSPDDALPAVRSAVLAADSTAKGSVS